MGLKLGRSVGVGVNIINRDVDARIGNGSDISTTGAVTVAASSSEDYLSIAAAPALGGSVNKPNFGGAQFKSYRKSTMSRPASEMLLPSLQPGRRRLATHVIDVDAITVRSQRPRMNRSQAR